MDVVERPFSDLLRCPNEVIAELASQDVQLRRRNAPALRLSRADHHRDRSEAHEASARMLRVVAIHSPDALGAALRDAFAWVEFLPPQDRQLFAQELTRVLLASASVDIYSPVAQLIREWKATAEIHADPELTRRLQCPLEAEGDSVMIPVG